MLQGVLTLSRSVVRGNTLHVPEHRHRGRCALHHRRTLSYLMILVIKLRG